MFRFTPFVFFVFLSVFAPAATLAQKPDSSVSEVDVVWVYDEAVHKPDRLWVPSGWMPDGQAISFADSCVDQPKSGVTCIKFGYQASQREWVGIYWLARGASWGQTPGPDLGQLLGAQSGDSVSLVWYARAITPKAQAEFKVGGMSSGRYPDSIHFPLTTGYQELPSKWQHMSLELTGQDLSRMSSGFCVVSDRAHNPGQAEVWFAIDDVRFEIKRHHPPEGR